MNEYCKSCVHDKGDIGFCDKCSYTYMLKKRGLPPTEYEAKLKPQANADRIRAMVVAQQRIETGIYDIEEVHSNCTVQIWRNSQTGEESIGWWTNE